MDTLAIIYISHSVSPKWTMGGKKSKQQKCSL